MIAEFGLAALWLAAALAALQLFAGLLGLRESGQGLAALVRPAATVQALLCALAFGALLLLFAKQGDSFAAADEPEWVADWMKERTARAARRADQAARPADKPVDAEAQAKRAAQRAARVRDGVAGCRVWLEDLVRRGLAAAQADAAGEWERAAARLVPPAPSNKA